MAERLEGQILKAKGLLHEASPGSTRDRCHGPLRPGGDGGQAAGVGWGGDVCQVICSTPEALRH